MRRYNSSGYKPRSIKRLERKNKRNLFVSIALIFLVGYLFLTWGLPAFVSSLTFLNKYKSSGNSSKPASEDPAIAPPVLNIPYEATNSATIKISGYASTESQIEIYVDGELKDTSSAREDGSFISGDIPLSLGTNNIYGKTINRDNKKSLASKTIKLIYSNEKPQLEITEPQDNFQVKGGDKKVKVAGKTDPNNTVSINGILTIVNNQGNFSTDVSLNDGDNTITITSTNSVGNSTTITKKVNYSPS